MTVFIISATTLKTTPEGHLNTSDVLAPYWVKTGMLVYTLYDDG